MTIEERLSAIEEKLSQIETPTERKKRFDAVPVNDGCCKTLNVFGDVVQYPHFQPQMYFGIKDKLKNNG